MPKTSVEKQVMNALKTYIFWRKTKTITTRATEQLKQSPPEQQNN